MIDEGWITENLEGIRHIPIEVLFKNFHGGNEENKENNLGPDNRWASLDSNQAFTEHKYRALPLH